MYQETNHPSLHSNMFLLIPARISPVITTGSVFTFQYVSINTMDAEESSIPIVTLHSNMFLLILLIPCGQCIGCRSLHSNMFLLIPDA